METNIVSVKYEDKYEPGTFAGKEYSYFTDIKLEVGELVQTPTAFGTNVAIVTKINVPEENIKGIKPYMKVIISKINKQRYLDFAEIQEEAA